MTKMGEFEFDEKAVMEIRDRSILEALHKILKAEASKVSFVIPRYNIEAYALKGEIIIKVKPYK